MLQGATVARATIREVPSLQMDRGVPQPGLVGTNVLRARKEGGREIFCTWSKGSKFPKAVALPKPSKRPLITQHCSALGTWPGELGVVEVVRSSQGARRVLAPLFMGSPPAAVTPGVWRLQVLLVMAIHRCCLPTHPGGCPLNHPHLSPSSCLPTPPD